MQNKLKQCGSIVVLGKGRVEEQYKARSYGSVFNLPLTLWPVPLPFEFQCPSGNRKYKNVTNICLGSPLTESWN